MFGLDPKWNDVRTLVLSRLSRASLDGRRFEVPKKFDLNEFMKGSIGLFKGRDDFEVVVDLDAFAADDVRGRRLHSSQELTELPKGMLRVRLQLRSLEQVERWVLSMGARAAVVGAAKVAGAAGEDRGGVGEKIWWGKRPET